MVMLVHWDKQLVGSTLQSWANEWMQNIMGQEGFEYFLLHQPILWHFSIKFCRISPPIYFYSYYNQFASEYSIILSTFF